MENTTADQWTGDLSQRVAVLEPERQKPEDEENENNQVRYHFLRSYHVSCHQRLLICLLSLCHYTNHSNHAAYNPSIALVMF